MEQINIYDLGCMIYDILQIADCKSQIIHHTS
jgi:hypothetical protein